MIPITLFTKRLILRRTIPADQEDLFYHYTSDPISSRFLTRKPHKNIEETAIFLNNWCDIPWEKEAGQFAWVISLKDTQKAIGIFLVSLEGEHKAEIHYGIARDYWRKGLGTESSQVAVDWLIKQAKLERIWAVCELSNNASIKMLEKIGFEKEGILRKYLHFPSLDHSARDCFIYAKIIGSPPAPLPLN